jgi:hypothetical protein
MLRCYLQIVLYQKKPVKEDVALERKDKFQKCEVKTK